MPQLNVSHDPKDIYRWASCLTAEARGSDWIRNEYFWTEEAKRARYRLENAAGLLTIITGLQGAGKSSLHQALTAILSDHFHRVKDDAIAVGLK